MKTRLRLCGDLESRDVIFDHQFIFERSLDFRALITRYRGTVCRDTSTGSVITAWQKSLYRFGNFPLEEAICATILLDRNGLFRGRKHCGTGCPYASGTNRGSHTPATQCRASRSCFRSRDNRTAKTD